MDWTALVVPFSIVAVAELGDKTQLTAIVLSSRYKPASVFLGAVCAFALISGTSVLGGGALHVFLPFFWVNLGSGAVFIAFGIYMLTSEGGTRIKHSKYVWFTSFLSMALMELGDKTQVATILIAAKYALPLQVFTGAFSAELLITITGILLGANLWRVIPLRMVKRAAAGVFLVFGFLFLANALTGFSMA